MIRGSALTTVLLAAGIAALSGAYAASSTEADGPTGTSLREAKRLAAAPAEPVAGGRRELSGLPMNVAKRLLDFPKPASSAGNVDVNGVPLSRAKRP